MNNFLLQPYRTESGLAGGMRQPADAVRASMPTLPAQAACLIVDAREYAAGGFGIRLLMESHLEAVIDGLILAAYACGAELGYIFVSGRYPLIWRNLQTIIRERREMGMLGTRIFGTKFNFDMEARLDVMGEGSDALLLSQLAGRLLPPSTQPADRGMAIVSVVEVIRLAQGWAAAKPPQMSETRLVAVSGATEHPGLYEIAAVGELKEVFTAVGVDADCVVQIEGAGPCYSVAEVVSGEMKLPQTNPLNLVVVEKPV